MPTTDVYHWTILHSQECYKKQYADHFYLDSVDHMCGCTRDFALAYGEWKIECDADGYVFVPPSTIDSINDRWEWLCDGHSTVEEALECAISDTLPGLDSHHNQTHPTPVSYTHLTLPTILLV